jgi:hypothetical protein
MLTQAEADFLHSLEKQFESSEVLPFASEIGNYVSWLNEELRVEELGTSCVISTPFLDRHNDEIEVYVEKRDDGQLFLTDDGYTLSDLRHCGVELDTAKREAHLDKILNGFGVRLSGDELHVHTSAKDFPQRKHNLIQAILTINDMFVMGEESVLQLFKEDVEKLLRQHHIPVFRDLKLSGHSGFDHKFDFGIPGSESEAVLQAVNRLTRDHAASIAFMVSDVMRARGEGALVAYAFLNDEGNELNSDHIDALTAYNIRPLRWSKREEGVERLREERKI